MPGFEPQFASYQVTHSLHTSVFPSISSGGDSLLDFLELWQVLSTYDRHLRDPLWRPQETPVIMRVARGPLVIPLPSISLQSKGLSRVLPQFKSINSSVLSLLHSPTLTSIHDHRKNHSLD